MRSAVRTGTAQAQENGASSCWGGGRGEGRRGRDVGREGGREGGEGRGVGGMVNGEGIQEYMQKVPHNYAPGFRLHFLVSFACFNFDCSLLLYDAQRQTREQPRPSRNSSKSRLVLATPTNHATPQKALTNRAVTSI